LFHTIEQFSIFFLKALIHTRTDVELINTRGKVASMKSVISSCQIIVFLLCSIAFPLSNVQAKTVYSPLSPLTGGYRSREQLLADFFALENRYPAFVSHEEFGKTVEGRPMIVFRIGVQNASSKVMFDGACHGNEILGSEVLYYYALWLLNETEPVSSEILQNTLTLIVPVVNVDRYNATRKNAHGVDLNRNLDWNWNGTATTGGGVSDDPTDRHYRGPYPESEPETRAYVKLWMQYKPENYLNLHMFDSPTIWYSQNTSEQDYFLGVYANYSRLAAERGQDCYPMLECGGTGCYDCTVYHMFGIHGWSLELSSTLPDYSEVPVVLDQWLPMFITLSLSSRSQINVPEFLSFPILTLFLTVASITATIFRRKKSVCTSRALQVEGKDRSLRTLPSEIRNSVVPRLAMSPRSTWNDFGPPRSFSRTCSKLCRGRMVFVSNDMKSSASRQLRRSLGSRMIVDELLSEGSVLLKNARVHSLSEITIPRFTILSQLVRDASMHTLGLEYQ
jgi:hypothetical protein